MTLQQLRYALCVAEIGTFCEAARKLYVSQPSLSLAVKELEEELNITLFARSNKGASMTKVGEEFFRNAKQIIMQLDLLEKKFTDKVPVPYHLSVSTQHYAFVSLAFVELVNHCENMEYELILNETKTLNVIEDVKTLRSEIGIIYLSNENESIIGKILADSQLTFTELFITYPYILVGAHHPLATLSRVTVDELNAYPCISFVQNNLEPEFFSEEVVDIIGQKQSIKISDRAALADLLGKSNAYIVSTGLYVTESKEVKKMMAIPLDVCERDCKIHVGLIKHNDIVPTKLTEQFCDIIKRTVEGYKLDKHVKRYY